MEIIARLIDMAMHRLPVDYEVEVTRAERQSTASKNRKAQKKSGSRGNKSDLMFRAHRQKLCSLKVESGMPMKIRFATIIIN